MSNKARLEAQLAELVRRLMGWTPPDGIYVPR